MDGNGRWAKQRHLPRIAGHKASQEAVHQAIRRCGERQIEVLTLFAFSSENWRRPKQEVNYLMKLFLQSLQKEVKKLHEQNVQFRIIGDRSRLDEKLQKQILKAEDLTKENTGLKLLIAVNYGGQWDIVNAIKKIIHSNKLSTLRELDFFAELKNNLSFHDLPDPDLFIRTSGEKRISNFMLWQLAYTELYFTDVLWPDFTAAELDNAIAFFANRERRFGFTGEQIRTTEDA